MTPLARRRAFHPHPLKGMGIPGAFLNHDITDRPHYTLQHDLGVAQDVAGQESAEWFGINQYLFYDIDKQLSAGPRLEWFRDDDGYRVSVNGLSGPASYFAVTIGLNWKVLKWVIFRPEVRYDWVDSESLDAFDNTSDDDQFLVAADVIIRFWQIPSVPTPRQGLLHRPWRGGSRLGV